MKISKTRRLPAVVAIFSGLFLFASCADDDQNTTSEGTTVESLYEEAKDGGFKYAASLLEDGYVSLEEYQQANQKFLECMNDAGMPGRITGVNRIDGWRINIEIESTPQFTEEYLLKESSNCTETYSMYSELGYEASNKDQMDVPLLEAAKACLTEKAGTQFIGTEQNTEDLIAAVGEDKKGLVKTCVMDNHHKLYAGESSFYVD